MFIFCELIHGQVYMLDGHGTVWRVKTMPPNEATLERVAKDQHRLISDCTIPRLQPYDQGDL